MDNSIQIAGSILSLPIFILLGSLLWDAFKAGDRLRPGSIKNSVTSKGKIKRRRIETNPNVIGSFPVQHWAGKNAPFLKQMESTR